MSPLPQEDPQVNETYLCVVSEWRGGRNSGNCYPLLVPAHGTIVADPPKEFPNAGAVFLPTRAGKAQDLILLRPLQNRTYTNQGQRDCYFVSLPGSIAIPEREDLPGTCSILTIDRLDPETRRIDQPSQLVTPVFFVRDRSRGGKLVGPLRRLEVHRPLGGELADSITWRADSPDGVAWVVPVSALELNQLRIGVYNHPLPSLNAVLERPHEFLLGKLEERIDGAEPIDLASPEDLVHFYESTSGIQLPPELASALETLPTRPGTDTPAYVRSRFDRLARLLRGAGELEGERQRIAREFLQTEEGKLQISSALADAKAQARREVEENLRSERQKVREEIERLEVRRSALEQDLSAEKVRREQLVENLTRLKEKLEQDVQKTGQELQKRVLDELPAFVALMGLGGGPRSAQENTGGAPTERRPGARIEIVPDPPARPFRPVENQKAYVRWLRDSLAASGLHYSLEMVANLFVCLKCSPLTLLGGPPGVGKSSLVRALPALLGQAHAFLELSVRRTWADDRALLGFPDVFHGRYECGSTGFVPHLIKAMKDLASGSGGIYNVLLDELNLAPPEYYFSEFLRILQMAEEERALRLYSPLSNLEGDPVPAQISVGPNVTFWGTVNLDETTESLSPRMLDRVHFVVLGPEDLEKPSAVQSPASSGSRADLGPLSYEQLRQMRGRDTTIAPEAQQILERVVTLLADSRDGWGSPIAIHPRQRKEIDRYLASAHDVLTPTQSADLVFNQRILPGLRGRGDAFRQRIEELERLLRGAGCKRSAARLARILAHAEENYQAFDFNVY